MLQQLRKWNSLKTKAGFWDKLKDKGLYNIRFLTSGAYLKDDTTVINTMIGIAESRGDAVVLVDHDENVVTKGEVQTYFDGIGTTASAKAKFSAGFTPWIHIASELIVSPQSNTMPGSFGYLLAFAQSVANNPSWLAVAGASRGRIPSIVSICYH